jgi:hypothetical protein
MIDFMIVMVTMLPLDEEPVVLFRCLVFTVVVELVVIDDHRTGRRRCDMLDVLVVVRS